MGYCVERESCYCCCVERESCFCISTLCDVAVVIEDRLLRSERKLLPLRLRCVVVLRLCSDSVGDGATAAAASISVNFVDMNVN